MKAQAFVNSLGAFAMLAAGLVPAAGMAAEDRPVPDTYTAVTTNMQPAGVELKADILGWSTDEQRQQVIAALSADDPVSALRALPTRGIIWRSGSVVGHAIKYAYRSLLDDGGEKITLVTDRRIGSTSFTPWVADDGPAAVPLDYSVVEFRTGADAGGTLSLGAAIVVDAEAGLVGLDPGDRAPLLTQVQKQPLPYWATED